MQEIKFTVYGLDVKIYQTLEGMDVWSLQLGYGFYNWNLPLTVVHAKTQEQLIRVTTQKVTAELNKQIRKHKKKMNG